MKFGKLRLKNYVPFQSASFDLDYEGITHIQAQNRDAENNNGKATNAAGKSRLFGAIPELFWDESPTGKDGVKSKKASYAIGIELKDVGTAKDEFDIVRKVGKKKGFKIIHNGKDTQVRTVPLGSKRVKEIIGMSEEDFYTRVYLDSNITHPLIAGSGKVRQEFFVNMFNLHSADSVRKLLLSEYREAQKNRAAYLEVRSMFDELKDKAIGKEELAKRKAKLKELTETQERVLKKFRKTQRLRDLLMFETDNADLIRRVSKLGDLENFESLSKEFRRKLDRAQALKEEAVAWRVYDKEKVAYKDKSKPIIKALVALLGPAWESQRADVEKRAKRAREAVTDLTLLEKNKERLEISDKPEEVEEPKFGLEECETTLRHLIEELQHAKEFKGGKCPTCGSKVKGRELAEIKEEIEQWDKRVKKAAAYETYANDLAKWKEARKRLKDLDADIEAAQDAVKVTSKWIEAETLINKLPDLPVPPGAERPDVEGIDEKIEKLQRKVNLCRQAKPVIDKIIEVQALTDDQRKAAKDFNKLGDEINEINNKVATLTAELNTAKDAINNLEQLASRGKSLKRKADDEPILKALIEIYSKKGLKKMMIERQAKRLEEQINKFRKLLFTENISFEFRYDKELQLLAHRKTERGDAVSDVRKLSGAERRMFAILLAIASITLMPVHKRSNVLILDEPEANLGPAAQNAFVRALPIINKIIPHIVVVSPRTDLEIPGARVFTIIKHRGKSSIHKGIVE